MPERPGGIGQGVYWRRRLTVLAAGIGLIAFTAWALTGFLGAHAGGAARGGAGRAQAAGGRATGAAARTATTARAASPASRQAGPGGGATAGQAARPAGMPPACAPRDVVLSLAASQGSYGPGTRPHFDVYVVSLSARDCSVNVAPAYLSVVIKAGGTGRVWGSADCAPRSAQFAQLSKGVPMVLHFSWDRRGSGPGCRTRAAARPGTYTATAVAPRSHLSSEDTIFVLSAPGVGMP